MELSIIMPAYNEEKYLPVTLETISTRLSGLEWPFEIIVVDNESTDQTAEIAARLGARVVREVVHVISKVRNTGANSANGDVFIFVDADTHIPTGLFEKIAEAMTDETCFGGAVAVEYGDLTRRWVRYYLLGWKFWERFYNTKQGATQFCRRSAYADLKGFDEHIFVGEDVEFYWRLTKLAEKRGGHVKFITEPKVKTSARRFNEMNTWRLLLRTNPIFVRLNWRRVSAWKDWYEKTIR